MQIPKSAELFDYLSKGNFISANAVNMDISHYYTIIEEHFQELQSLYTQVGFSLEAGNNYYYLSRQQEAKNTLETKLEKGRRWIDLMAFFTTFNPGFTRGFRFTPQDILKQIELNVELKEQLERLMSNYSKAGNYQEALTSILEQMSREGFIELENSLSQTYKVLDAYHYLEQMVQAVAINAGEAGNE